MKEFQLCICNSTLCNEKNTSTATLPNMFGMILAILAVLVYVWSYDLDKLSSSKSNNDVNKLMYYFKLLSTSASHWNWFIWHFVKKNSVVNVLAIKLWDLEQKSVISYIFQSIKQMLGEISLQSLAWEGSCSVFVVW